MDREIDKQIDRGVCKCNRSEWIEIDKQIDRDVC